MNTRIFIATILAAALTGCTSSASAVDCEQITVPKFTEITAWGKCTSCHSSALSGASRAGATPGINFDNYDDAVSDADLALSEVDAGAMPPSGSPTLTAAEKDQIVQWASCDTPQ